MNEIKSSCAEIQKAITSYPFYDAHVKVTGKIFLGFVSRNKYMVVYVKLKRPLFKGVGVKHIEIALYELRRHKFTPIWIEAKGGYMVIRAEKDL
jgi:hypothetical protein